MNSLGNCLCNPVFVENPNNKMCFPSQSGDCKTHFDCQQTGDKNTVCLLRKCRCKVNFKYNSATHLCEEINCVMPLDCQDIDKNRNCTDHKCVCKNNFAESKDDSLFYDHDNQGGKSNDSDIDIIELAKQYWWGLLILGLIIGIITWMLCCKRGRRKRDDTPVGQETHQMTPINVINVVHANNSS